MNIPVGKILQKAVYAAEKIPIKCIRHEALVYLGMVFLRLMDYKIYRGMKR